MDRLSNYLSSNRFQKMNNIVIITPKTIKAPYLLEGGPDETVGGSQTPSGH